MMDRQELLNAMAAPLLAWYDEHKRTLPWRGTKDPYRVWVSEIMLQQTRVAAVIPYYERWMEVLPTVAHLAEVDEEQLMKLWQGLGYYSRARNLRRAAQVIMEEHGGVFPGNREALLKLPGIGEYTAGAVASIAFDEGVPAVDGNVLRVAARVANVAEDILDAKVKKQFQHWMETAVPENRPGEYNQALMDLGATVCLPNGQPLCEECPLCGICQAKELGIQTELPLRAKKAKRRVEEMTVYLLVRGDEVALRKRDENGLLAGLWEFPHVPGKLSESDAAAPLSDWGLTAKNWEKTLTARHIFTHVEWRMTGYVVAVAGENSGFVWVNREELEKFAIPSAFAKFLTEARNELA